MATNVETRTIFINADGQFCTLGRGAIEVVDSITRESIAHAAIPGWVATMLGSPHERATPALTRLEAMNGAGDKEWSLGVEAFHAGHDLRNRGP